MHIECKKLVDDCLLVPRQQVLALRLAPLVNKSTPRRAEVIPRYFFGL